jgi:hypothetical protein
VILSEKSDLLIGVAFVAVIELWVFRFKFIVQIQNLQ